MRWLGHMALFVALAGTATAGQTRGPVTGLPLPRFVSLISDDVNLRVGPGLQYPIRWVFKRAGLPLEVLREFDVWRLVEDPFGDKGWVHQSTITDRRDFIVIGKTRRLRRAPNDEAAMVALLKPGVVGYIRRCRGGAVWCKIEVAGHSGWLKRKDFWGTFPGEAVR